MTNDAKIIWKRFNELLADANKLDADVLKELLEEIIEECEIRKDSL